MVCQTLIFQNNRRNLSCDRNRRENTNRATNDTITLKRNKQNRTIKQILGHLIDSASNNHQRMVRLQYSKDLLFFPDYRQDNDLWIALQDYQNEDWNNLIQLWKFLTCISFRL